VSISAFFGYRRNNLKRKEQKRRKKEKEKKATPYCKIELHTSKY
jgi:hypothetical protein